MVDGLLQRFVACLYGLAVVGAVGSARGSSASARVAVRVAMRAAAVAVRVTPQFDTVALLVMLELQGKLNGKVLGSSWPATPAELGTAFKERARSGTFAQLDQAITVDESPRLHVSAAKKALLLRRDHCTSTCVCNVYRTLTPR